jgi:crotonobetainyl-CoA:carnitine CoA-transferase CaiB-like acyl-CoA transferase
MDRQRTIDDRPAPLQGVRVIEMSDGKGEMCGRILADLGADVIKVEPPGGAPSRAERPLHGGVSLAFSVRNAGKRGVVIDLGTARGRDQLLTLLDGAEIWIEATRPGMLAELGLGPDSARARNPALVVLSITDFGQTGPYREWVATDPVLVAMGGVLSRSGLPGREPLIPPAEMALALTAAQAAWAALVAYWNRLQTGRGDYIDFSLYEATAQAIEPAMGTVGTAQAAGYEPTRDRPAPGPYPIFRCRDGHVRVALLAARQWQAMRAWLGDPEELRDPELDTIRGRALAADRLHAVLEQHFAGRSRHELTLEGQGRGVPIAAVLTPDEVLAAEHFRVRGAITRRELAPGITAELPTGFAELDGRRLAAGHRAPVVGEHTDEVLAEPIPAAPPQPLGVPPSRRRPLEGLRILDFGVIVFGAELARLFCELGADVIKVESREFPDGARVSPVHFAIGHRGSRSIGVNLRSRQGAELVRRLAAQSDVLLANFKPGTLEKLGLGATVLHAVNPGLVIVNGSALGATGPWSSWMGYGPLVRCVSGLTSLWRYTDDAQSFSDSTVIHPDHYAARLSAIAALATLIGRRQSGHGAVIAVSQAETILMQLSTLLAAQSLVPGQIQAAADASAAAAPWGLYPCAGDDEWCVVTVRDDDDWRRLREALQDPAWAADGALATAGGRVAQRREIDAQLSSWTRARAPREIAAALQRAGVPAGFMQRPEEYEDDPQFQARDFLRMFEQPGLGPRPVEHAPFRSESIPPPENRPAPEPGEHTREICAELLGLDDGAVDELLAAGAIEEPQAAPSTVFARST